MTLKNQYSILNIKPTTQSISKNIKELEEDTLNNLRKSKANNTLRAYKADYKDFSLFCSKNNFQSMPTQPKIMALYLTHLSKTSKYSTLKRRLASISILHKMKGHYIDTKHPIIMENLMGFFDSESNELNSEIARLGNAIRKYGVEDGTWHGMVRPDFIEGMRLAFLCLSDSLDQTSDTIKVSEVRATLDRHLEGLERIRDKAAVPLVLKGLGMERVTGVEPATLCLASTSSRKIRGIANAPFCGIP